MGFPTGGAPELASGTFTDLSSVVSLSTRSGSISSSTNSTPVVVTSSTAHGMLYGTITAVAPGPPIVITSAGHGLTTGDKVVTSPPVYLPIGSNATNAQQVWATTVRVIDGDTFAIPAVQPIGPILDQWQVGATWCRAEPTCVDGHLLNTGINNAPSYAYATSPTAFALIGPKGVADGGATGGWRVLPEYGTNLQLNTLVAPIDGGDGKGGDPVGEASGGVTSQPTHLSSIFNEGGSWAWFGYRFKETNPDSGAQLAWRICGVVPSP